MEFKRLNIVYGHYGTGKTNFTLNCASALAKRGERVTVVDLDIVNPYFRSSDYHEELKRLGIRLIAPISANTTLESPALPADVYSAFSEESGTVFFDVGGDDAGAYALGRYSEQILKSESWQALFVVNKFRSLIALPGDAVSLMREIEAASHVPVTGIVNNSHVAEFTTPEDVLAGYAYAKEVGAFAGLPLAATAVPARFADSLQDKIENIMPVEVLVNLPWNAGK
ncbi:MAG: ParA family protein [Oscillospiraceae bacterium]|nr:ParA family protein [Oscillospiraceae bacterium]